LKTLILTLLLPLYCFGSFNQDFDENFLSALSTQPTGTVLTFTYETTYPSAIVLGSTYSGPADASKALYNAGNGWKQYSSKTINVSSKKIFFKGDWRTGAGTIAQLFNQTFTNNHYVSMSGGFDINGSYKPNMFQSVFYGCNGIRSIPSGLFGSVTGMPQIGMCQSTFSSCNAITGAIPSNLFGNIEGPYANNMFAYTFYNCSKLTNDIPANLFGSVTGAPAYAMFQSTFSGCTSLRTIPDYLFGDLKGAPSGYMFDKTFYNCRGITNLPYGIFGSFGNGLIGPPAPDMFSQTFRDCIGLTTLPYALFQGLTTGTAQNNMFLYTFYGCKNITSSSATLNSGVKLYTKFPAPDFTFVHIGGCFKDCTSMSDYATMPDVWKQ